MEADQYSPSIWNTDQDLTAMQQHVTGDFFKVFKEAHKAYTSGDWPTAIQKLELAKGIMFQTVVDDGYLEEEVAAQKPAARQRRSRNKKRAAA